MSSYRIATNQQYMQSQSSISGMQVRLASLQTQIATGQHITKISDDPIGVYQSERAYSKIQRSQANLDSLGTSKRNLDDADSQLANLNDLYGVVRELLVQGGNDSLTSVDKKIIGQQLDSIRSQILVVANAQNSDGVPIFTGLGGPIKPFVESVASGTRTVNFLGLPGQQAPTESMLPSTIDGQRLFMKSSGSIFDSLDTAINALNTNTNSGATINNVLGDLNQYMDAMSSMRGLTGSYLQRQETFVSWTQDTQTSNQTKYDSITGTDMTKSIMELQTTQIQLQAALQTYSQIQKLSLFNYM